MPKAVVIKANTAAIITNTTTAPPILLKSKAIPLTTAAAVLAIAIVARFPTFIVDDVVFTVIFFVFKSIFFLI